MRWWQRLFGPERMGVQSEDAQDSAPTLSTPTSLEGLHPDIENALQPLPISDEAEVRKNVAANMEAWKHGRTFEGNLPETVQNLAECFRADVGELGFHFDVSFEGPKDHGALTAPFATFICGQAVHNVWRFGPQQYIAVLHRRRA